MLRKVLVADDSIINRDILSKILSTDYELFTAQNGEEALAILHANGSSISAVLLDLAMPRKSGYDVLQEMRMRPELASIPVIVTTNSTDSAEEVKALSLGANDFITKPYNAAVIKHRLRNTINLRETAALMNSVQKDKLTGLYNRETFFAKAAEMIAAHPSGYYFMVSCNIDNFKVINDQYGNDKGDQVLRFVADVLKRGMTQVGGICCRIMADHFALLYPQKHTSSRDLEQIRREVARLDGSIQPITYSIGRYLVDDLSLSPSAMYDRASIAEASVKARFDIRSANYDDSMYKRILREQEIVNDMSDALVAGQFEVWLQPQYNHSSGALIGSEALVRWRHPTKGLISPIEFIPVFERNGFIYELDKFVWEQVCALLREWLANGREPLPISVNVSRYDLLREGFFETISRLVERYGIPIGLLRLEITESAFAKSTDQIIATVRRLSEYGFVIELDDFGSGYSSLNTLKDVPADILKLDMRFLEGNSNSRRGGNIVESIVRMAKWLGMPVIAEGVETKAHADYLASIGCFYVQGYLYARPMPIKEYEEFTSSEKKEQHIAVLETVDALDNNAFWDPSSLETLIFNSYVGGACIFEFNGKRAELLRVNRKYAELLGLSIEEALTMTLKDHFLPESIRVLHQSVAQAAATDAESTCEIYLTNIPKHDRPLCMRVTVRVIARAEKHLLLYCSVLNVTEQRESERRERRAAAQLRFLNETAQDLLSQNNDEQGIVRVLEKVRSYFDGSRAYVIEVDPVRNLANNTYEACGPNVKSERDKLQNVPRDMIPYWWDSYEDRNYIMVNSVDELDESRASERRLFVERNVQALLAVPLKRNNELIGFIGVDDPTQRLTHFDQLRAIADYVAVALARRDLTTKIAADNEMLKNLMNDTPGGFMRLQVNPDHSVVPVYINKGFCELVGMSEERLMKEYAQTPFWGVHQADQPVLVKTIEKMITRGTAQSPKFRLLHGNGEYNWFLVFGRRTHNESGAVFLNIYFTDISAQEKQALSIQETLPFALSAMMEASKERVFVKDRNFAYITCSHAFARYAGLDEPQDIVGKTDFDLFDAKHAELYREEDLSIMRNDESLVEREECLYSEDGQSYYLTTSKYPLHDSFGNTIGVFGVERDVTKDRVTFAQLKLLTDNIPGGLAIYELTSDRLRLLYCSDGYLAATGYTKDEYFALAETNPFQLIFREDIVHLRSIEAALRAGTDSFDFECRARKKDGGFCWINVRGTVGERREDAMTLNVIKFDVTKGKQVMEQLRIREREYALSIEHSGMVICRYLHSTRTLALPPSMAELLMLPQTASPMPDYVLERNDISSESMDGYLKFYESMARGDETGRTLVRRRVNTQEYRWFDLRFNTVYDGAGKPLCALLLIDDVTDSRAADIGIALDRTRLMEALRTVYPVTLSVNLTQGSYQTIIASENLFLTGTGKNRIALLIEENAAHIPHAYAAQFLELFRPEALLLSLNEDGQSVRMEYPQKLADNEMHWVETIAMRVKNEYTDDVMGVVLCRCIDEQKVEEEKLLHMLAQTSDELTKKQLYLNALDGSMPLGTVICTLNTTEPLYFGGKVTEELGYTREEFLDLCRDQLRGFVYEEDYGTSFTDMRFVQPAPDSYEQEYRANRKDGSLAWIYEKGMLVELDEMPTYIIVFMDVTRRREAEEHLRISEEELSIAMAQMGKMVCLFDPLTRTLTVPDVYARSYGTGSTIHDMPERLLERDMLAQDSRAGFASFYDSIFRGSRAGSCEYFIRDARGIWHWERADFVSVFDSANRPVKTIITVEDTTQLREKDDALEAYQETERMFRMVSTHSNRRIFRYNIASRTLHDGIYGTNADDAPPVASDLPESLIESGTVLPESAEDFRAMIEQIHSGSTSGSNRIHARINSGTPCWLDVQYSLVEEHNNTAHTAVISILDITDAHEKELAYKRYLQTTEEKANSGEKIIFLEGDVTTDLSERQGGALLQSDFPPPGSSRTEIIERVVKSYVVREDWDRAREFFSRERLTTLFSDGIKTAEEDWKIVFPDGSPGFIRAQLEMVQDPYTGHLKVYSILRDVSRELLAALDVQKKAETDGMTGLFNKTTAEARVRMRLDNADGVACAMLIADLDDLKRINDTLGHAQGDRAVRLLADLLRAQFRQNDIAGRIGGDEFLVFLDGCGSETILRGMLAAFMRRLATARIGDKADTPIHSSIGIAMGVTGEHDFSTLFRRADRALYHVKRNGKDDFAFYTPEMEKESYQYKGRGEAALWRSGFIEKEELSRLFCAVSVAYPLVISSNLSQNTYYMMRFDEFTGASLATMGVFDELFSDYQAAVHPEDVAEYTEMLSRENLLSAHAQGELIVRHTARQRGNLGLYRLTSTEVIFVQNRGNEDVLGVILSREVPQT